MTTTPTSEPSNLHDLPHDPELLEPEDRALLDIDHVQLWPRLNRDGREKLLRKLRKVEPRRRQARERQRQKQELADRYVDLLCSLPKPGHPSYHRAMDEFLAVKRAYQAVGGGARGKKYTVVAAPEKGSGEGS